jgi:hypothetical protein
MKSVFAVLLLAAVIIAYPWVGVLLGAGLVLYGVAWWSTHHPRSDRDCGQENGTHRRSGAPKPAPAWPMPEHWPWIPAAYREINRIEIAAGIPPTGRPDVVS